MAEVANYSDRLKNPLWQKFRLEVFKRDNFSCTRCCDDSNQLQVHHLDYIPGILPWNYPMDMVKTLCATCHAKENDRDMVEKYLYQTLKMKGFMVSDLLSLSCKVDTDIQFTDALLRALRRL